MLKKVLVKLKTLLFSANKITNQKFNVENSKFFNIIHEVFHIERKFLYSGISHVK